MSSVPSRVADFLLLHLERIPDLLALRVWHTSSFRDYRWSDLAQLVTRHAASLSHLPGGTHVATWLPNGEHWIAADTACQLLGLVHVALDIRLSPSIAWSLARHSHSRCLLTLSSKVQSLRQQVDQDRVLAAALPEIIDLEYQLADPELPASTPTDPTSDLGALLQSMQRPCDDQKAALMLYTSGTMARPKGVLLSHRNLLSNAIGKLAMAPQFDSDVRLNILPFSHAYARTCELSTWLISQSQMCVVPDWSTFLQAAPAIQPSLVNLVPHLAMKLCQSLKRGTPPASLLGSRLRLLQVGGAAMTGEDWQLLASAGWPPLQGYGLTETSPVICSNRAGQQRHDCVGYPIPEVQLRLDKSNVLWTRGPHVMQRYWNDEQATSESMQDGWFCTGDVAAIDGDGAVRILGRIDDMITLSTGYKVQPFEVSRRLQSESWLESLVIVGQNRPFISALVTLRSNQPDFDAALIADSERMRSVILERLNQRLNELPKWMHFGRVDHLNTPLTIENGGLNFKGAIRRRFVEEVLARQQVDELYRAPMN